jgi:hypothetical protein
VSAPLIRGAAAIRPASRVGRCSVSYISIARQLSAGWLQSCSIRREQQSRPARPARRLYERGRGVKCAVALLCVVLRAKPVIEGVRNRRVPARHPQGGPTGRAPEALDGGGDRRLGAVSEWVVASGAHVCIAPWRGDRAKWEGSFRRRNSIESRQAARRKPAPAGANGWLRVSMCQIASVSLRDSSIGATLGPRWRPSRRLVCC